MLVRNCWKGLLSNTGYEFLLKASVRDEILLFILLQYSFFSISGYKAYKDFQSGYTIVSKFTLCLLAKLDWFLKKYDMASNFR